MDRLQSLRFTLLLQVSTKEKEQISVFIKWFFLKRNSKGKQTIFHQLRHKCKCTKEEECTEVNRMIKKESQVDCFVCHREKYFYMMSEGKDFCTRMERKERSMSIVVESFL